MSSLQTAPTMLRLAERRALEELRRNADTVAALLTREEACDLLDLLRRRLELSCPDEFALLRSRHRGSQDLEIRQTLLQLDCTTLTELLLFEQTERRLALCLC